MAASAISEWKCLWMGLSDKYCKAALVVSQLEKCYRNMSPFTSHQEHHITQKHQKMNMKKDCGSVFRLFSSIYQDVRTCSPHSATERVILTLKEYIWALSQWTCGRYLQRIKVTLNIVLNFQGQFSSGKNSYLQLTAIFNLEQTSPSPGIYQPIWAKIQNWPLN